MKYVSHYYFCVFLLIISINSVLNTCDSQWDDNKELNNDSYPIESFYYKKSIAKECGCPESFCLRKCCQKNYILKNGMCVLDKDNSFTDHEIPFVINEGIILKNVSELKILPGRNMCRGNKSATFTTVEIGDIFTDARIREKDGKLWLFLANWDFDYEQYCIEYAEAQVADGKIEGEASAFICDVDYVDDLNFGDRLSFIGTMISLPFLLVTFIVYALLPQRNLHGTSLMCYVFALFVAYLLLDVSYLYTGEVTYVTCRVMGMVTLFCFLSSIFWMNVMSYDIYSTFKGSRGFLGNKKAKERKRFLLYSAYAWGVPLLLIGLIIGLSQTKTNAWYDPGIRGEECFLRDGYPELLYFYGPLAILITANIVMFIITAVRIKRVQKDTEMLTRKGSKKHSGSDNEDQYRFSLYIKLLFAMGINWSVEIINWALSWQITNLPPAVWYLTDFCNAAYGVIIFFVFVFKKSIWKSLQKRYYMCTGKSPPTQNTESSRTAPSTSN